jgi:hypothetical protein
MDGDAGRIVGRVGLGTTEVYVPWQPDGQSIANDQIHVVVGGLTGALAFTQASKEITLTGAGLGAGPSYAEVRGQRIFQVDLNAMDGRMFDATVSFGPSGEPRLAVQPRFDLAMLWHLAAVAGDFKSPPPAHLLDETYRLLLAPAAGQGPVLEPYGSDAPGSESGIRVVSGSLSLASSNVPAPVTAAAGQCVTSGEPAPGEHPVLGSLKVKACP